MTALFVKVITTLFMTQRLQEPIITIAIDRFSTPKPKPWGLKVLLRYFVYDKEINIFRKSYVVQSKDVQLLLSAVREALKQ